MSKRSWLDSLLFWRKPQDNIADNITITEDPDISDYEDTVEYYTPKEASKREQHTDIPLEHRTAPSIRSQNVGKGRLASKHQLDLVDEGDRLWSTPPCSNADGRTPVTSTPCKEMTPQWTKKRRVDFEDPTMDSVNFQSTSNLTGQRKQRRPAEFDGEKIEWPDYKELFETTASYNGWNEQEKVEQLKMSLRGQALKALTDASSADKHSYTLLCTALQQRFCPPEGALTYRMMFRNRTQTSLENASQYGYDLQRLVNRAFTQASYLDRQEHLVDQFMHGLKDEKMQEHVIFHHPQNINEAIQLATEYESWQGRKTKAVQKPMVMAAKVNTEGNSAAMEETKQLVGTVEKLVDKFEGLATVLSKMNTSDQRGRRDWSKVECYNCHQKGHIARNCQVPKAPVNSNPNHATSQNVGATTGNHSN